MPESGNQHASEKLLPLVYDKLRKLAVARMASGRPDHTLQATALVHDAYVRLMDVDKTQRWDLRGHFFAAAGEAMRRILAERPRRNLPGIVRTSFGSLSTGAFGPKLTSTAPSSLTTSFMSSHSDRWESHRSIDLRRSNSGIVIVWASERVIGTRTA